MPVVAVNVAATVFAEIQTYVERGLYASPAQFLEIAAFNQLALERGATPQEVVERGHRELGVQPAAGRTAPPQGSKQPSGAKGPTRKSEPVQKRATAPRHVSESVVEGAIGRLSLAPHTSVPALPAATKRPDDERLWGQVNRLFPLKLACRWIAVANAASSEWQRLDAIFDQLAADASTLGSFLEKLDGAMTRKRDDLLATGLPRAGNLPSRDRFLSQVVARVTRASEIYPGALTQYALAVFDGDHLTLTDRGFELARLANPVLDEDVRSATTTLSAAERDFFVEQVLTFVPGEHRDLAVVLAAVNGLNSTPEPLVEAVKDRFPREWSESMLRTHVSGLVARSVEMGLLGREWKGRNVYYIYMDRANALVAEGAR